MATHSSTLAWEIPWTEEPGELVHGVTRVRHDLLTKTTTITYKIYAKVYSYTESGSGSINGVAPKGSIFASNILLIIELPAIEAASPALKPGQKKKYRITH